MRKILIFAVATIIASSMSAFAQAQYAPSACAYGYYQNADGICVHKPTRSRMKVQPLFVAMVSIPMRHVGRIFAPIMAVLPSY